MASPATMFPRPQNAMTKRLGQIQPPGGMAPPTTATLQPRVATAAAAPAPVGAGGVSSLGSPGSSSGFGWLGQGAGQPYHSSVGTFPQQGQNTSAINQAQQDTYAGSAMDFANRAGNQVRANGPFIDFAQRQGMSDPTKSPFYKALLTQGREGVSDSYNQAGAESKMRGNLSGFGYAQPVSQGADRELSAAEAHDASAVPGQALMATPDLMNKMLAPGMAGAGIRADEAGALAKVAAVPAGISGDYGQQGLGYFNAASDNEMAKRQRQSAFEQSLMQSLISGASNVASAKYGCWIAEAIYGVDDPRTMLLRLWLNLEYKKTKVGRVVMAVYLAIGQSIAKAVKRSSLLKRGLRPLFEAGLRRAQKWSVNA